MIRDSGQGREAGRNSSKTSLRLVISMDIIKVKQILSHIIYFLVKISCTCVVSCSLFIHVSKSRLTLCFRKEKTFIDLTLHFITFISPAIFNHPLNKKVLPLPDKTNSIWRKCHRRDRLFHIMYEQKPKTQQQILVSVHIWKSIEHLCLLVLSGRILSLAVLLGVIWFFIPNSQSGEHSL